MRTHPVDKLLEQHCYKSAAGLLQLVRLYVCNMQTKQIIRQLRFKQVEANTTKQQIQKLLPPFTFDIAISMFLWLLHFIMKYLTAKKVVYKI